MERFADLILNNRKPVIAITILLVLASIYPVLNVKADFSLEGFFPEDDPTIDAYERFSEEYGRDDNAIVIGVATDDVLDDAFLNQIRSLTKNLSEITNVSNVRSIFDAQRLVNNNGMLESQKYLTEEISTEKLREEITTDAFTEGLFINEESDFTAIYIEIDEEKNNFPVREQVIADMQQALDNTEGLEIYVAGIPYFRNQYVNVLNSEIIFYISISSVLIILLLWFLFRNVQGIIIPITIVWLTILFTVAVIYFSGGVFEVLTSTIAPILLCVGIADSVHMLSKYQDNRSAGMLRSRAMRESLIVLGSATFLTSVTTAIGFATLATSNVIPMRTFGLYTAVGVIIAYIITIFLLPSMLPFFKDEQEPRGRSGRVHELIGSMLRFSFRTSLRYHKAVVIITLLLTVAIGTGISQLKVNGYVFDDVGQDSPLIADSHVIADKMTPQFPLEIIIDTGSQNGITDPEMLRRVDALEQKLKSYDEFAKVLSLTDVMRRVHQTMSPEKAADSETGLPGSRELAAQYLLLLEITDGDGLNRFTDFDYREIRVSAQSFDVGSYRINQIRSELQNYMDEHFQEASYTMTGTTILVADLTDNIVYSLGSSIVLAFVFISLIMAWLFRNGRVVLISLLPNVMPLIVIAGIMGYFGIDIKPSTAVIFTIAFGIAVDDSIHYLARFRIETNRGRNLIDAMRTTTERTGRAIVLTSAILLVGFGTLGNSEFDSTMYMGQLVSITIFTALIADLFFLPALIYWIRPKLEMPDYAAGKNMSLGDNPTNGRAQSNGENGNQKEERTLPAEHAG